MSVNLLAAGINKFNEQDYSGAIADLELLNLSELTIEQVKMRNIRLLQCYIKTNRLEDAQYLCTTNPVDDGLFRLLESVLALQQERLDDALDAARSARSETSLYDTTLTREASFQIASILHSRYLLRPNRKNLEKSLNSWEEYISSFCSGRRYSKECREAAERVAMLQ